MVVLVCVDGGRRPDPTLAVGAALAEGLGLEVVALHVMPEDRYGAARDARAGDGGGAARYAVHPTSERQEPPENPYPLDAAQGDAARVAREVARETLGEEPGVRVQGRVGDPVERILREADQRDAEYVVVGGRKRTAVGKAVFGSVTQSVLQESDRPVVTVPADDLAEGRDGPVVAAVDQSPRAARVVTEAERLAGALGRALQVVHVAPETDPGALLEGDGPPDDDALRAAAARAADEVAADHAAGYEAVGLVGPPSQRLLEHATAVDAAFIVAAGRKRSPVGKVLFGSVTQSLLLGADRPVLGLLVDE